MKKIWGQASLIVVIGLLLATVLFYGTVAGVQDLRSKDEVDALGSLEVMTCNIGDLGGYKILSNEEVVDFLKLSGVPDVLLLQEVKSENGAEYFSNKLGLKYFVFLSDAFQRSNGMAILSRFPLSNPDKIYFKASKYGYGALAVDATIGDNLKGRPKTIQVVNVHMDRIDSVTMKDKKVAVNLGFLLRFIKNEIWEDSVRSESAKELIQWLDEKKADNVILGGDFNSVPLSKTIRTIGSRFDDALWPSLQYLTGTYKRLDFPIAPKVDYLFLSPNLYSRKASVLPISPGDHFPVVALVEYK
ncbi:MAG: endonuclease/exonuclease/phosphatase family protein [Proteobacteria bacterium]|nr:endonuclease/exonuclease/phosphatase family protein [Pseudomonadota bacterium]